MALLRVVPLLMLAFSATSVLSSNLRRNHELRQFNAGHDAYYRGTKGGGGGGSISSSSKACKMLGRRAIVNANVRCASSGCRLKCDSGYKMESSRSIAHLNCDSSTGRLTYNGEPWEVSLPPCLPFCRDGCPKGSECAAPNQCEFKAAECPEGFTGPDCFDAVCSAPCQNGGTCLLPDVCDCPPGYSGMQCQQHRCNVPKVVPQHATIGGTTELDVMDVKCNPGYKMKNGQTSMVFNCNHHQWLSQDEKLNFSGIDLNCYAYADVSKKTGV